jgi:uncharacterized protein
VNVVCNTSPLLLLAKIQQLALLAQLYQTIWIPTAVLAEVHGKADEAAARIQAITSVPPFVIQSAKPATLAWVPAALGAGEREALALAVDTTAALVILDDQEGRRLARTLGLTVTGTAGVLVEAYTRGLVPSLRAELDRLRHAGWWITEAFYHRLCQLEER